MISIDTEIESIKEECSEEGWDGYGGWPINLDSINHCREFIISHILGKLPLPEVCPEPSGNLGMEWRLGERSSVAASFEPDGSFHYGGVRDSVGFCGRSIDKFLQELVK